MKILRQLNHNHKIISTYHTGLGIVLIYLITCANVSHKD